MKKTLAPLIAATSLLLAACGGGGGDSASTSGLSGTVSVDGSSTVFPITEAVAEEFQKEHRGVRVTVGVSGTGGGFKKFDLGETDINDASRVIKEKEAQACMDNGIEYIELPVAFDGISVVVHPDNDFVDHLSVEELTRIWQPGSTVKTWADVREGWPDEEIKLYGPGVDSGTFDYFTEAINGKSQACRSDFTASEDDNVLVQGVAGDHYSLGFFGFAYYEENQDRLKVVPIGEAGSAVAPSVESINDGSYTPLSRPIFIYVNKAAADRPEVDAFVDFYLANAPVLVREVGYVPLPDDVNALVKARYDDRVTGSALAGKDIVGVHLGSLLK